jgi:hypothetical protein
MSKSDKAATLAESLKPPVRPTPPQPDLPPRCVDREVGAGYIGCSTDTLDRLINSGILPVVKLPVEHRRNGREKTGTSRRVLIDLRDLDALIERSKEKRG